MQMRPLLFRMIRLIVPLPLVCIALIGTGVAFGDLLLSTAHTLGSVPMKWLGIAAMLGGPLAGIALFVYHLFTTERR